MNMDSRAKSNMVFNIIFMLKSTTESKLDQKVLFLVCLHHLQSSLQAAGSAILQAGIFKQARI